jgi:hypothetical protein
MEKEDFYPILLDNNAYRFGCLTLSFISITVGTPFLYSVIWFEKFGSDKKRTILNLLFSLSNYLIIFFLWFIQIPETLRYIVGPLPFFICYGQQILRNFFVISMMLFADVIIVIRYAFIFWLKNPAAFHDDFWYCFLSVWNFGFCAIMCCARHCLGSYHVFALYVCTGQASNMLLNGPSIGSGIFLILSILLNIVAHIKIYIYKKKPTVLPMSRGCLVKSIALADIEEMNLFTFALSFIFVLIMTISFVNLFMLSDATHSNFNNYPYFLSVYFRSFVVPATGVLTIIVWFIRKSNYRQAMSTELNSLKNKLWPELLN